MDRVNISSAMPVIQRDLGLSAIAVGWIFSSFRWGYALFQIPGGWFGDKARPTACPRLHCVLVVALHLIDRTLFERHFARRLPIPLRRGRSRSLSHRHAFSLPLDAARRTWLLARLTPRGFSLGRRADPAARRPPHDPLRLAYALFLFGLLGLAWAATWYWYYRDRPADHRSVNAAELAVIRQPEAPSSGSLRSVPWRIILRNRTVWMLAMMYFCYGYASMSISTGFPKYLYDARGVNLKQMGFYASLPFVAGAVGNLLGGWLSDRWAARTGNLRAARRVIAVVGFLIAAGSILPATFTSHTTASVFLLLHRSFRPGVDRGRILGHSTRYRGRLCGFHRIHHEHLRKSRRRHLTRLIRLSPGSLWLERPVYHLLHPLHRGYLLLLSGLILPCGLNGKSGCLMNGHAIPDPAPVLGLIDAFRSSKVNVRCSFPENLRFP